MAAKCAIDAENLPLECVDEVLKRINACSDRNNARLVCKAWSTLLDRDSSNEWYKINGKYNYKNYFFRKLATHFAGYRRRKISFHFKNVILDDTSHFWKVKGAEIKLLQFDQCALDASTLSQIIERCVHAHSLAILRHHDVVCLLHECRSLGLVNSSIRYVNLGSDSLLNCDDASSLTRDVANIFPRLAKLTLTGMFVSSEDANTLPPGCADYNFEKVFLGSLWCTHDLIAHTQAPFQMMNVHLEVHNEANLISFLRSHPWLKGTHVVIKYDGGFSFSKFEKLLSNLSILILIADSFGFSTTTINNKLSWLELNNNYNTDPTDVDATFFATFKYLKWLNLSNVSYRVFIEILQNLNLLESLEIMNKIIYKNDSPCEDVVVVHENMKELRIPPDFLSKTTTAFRMPNLRKIFVKYLNTAYPFPTFQLEYDEMRRIECQDLKSLELALSYEAFASNGKEGVLRWMKEIISLYPKLQKFKLASVNGLYEGYEFNLNYEDVADVFQLYPKLMCIKDPLIGTTIFRMNY